MAAERGRRRVGTEWAALSVIRAICAGVVAAGATGCFDPGLPADCSLRCDSANICPQGMVCAAGFCVRPGSPRKCGDAGGGGGGGIAESGGASGGIPASGGVAGTRGGSHVGGQSSSGGSLGGGGAAGHPSGGVSNAGGDGAGATSAGGHGGSGLAGGGTGGSLTIVPQILPDPCQSTAYSAKFDASGGRAPYGWDVAGVPAGLTFDSKALTISGVPTAAGVITARVTDADGLEARVDYPLTPRKSCWLAFVSSWTGRSRVTLFDPILDKRVVLPASMDTTPVVDFKFSPDGQFLAYRHGDSLRLARAPDWQDQVLDFGDLAQVLEYAWSPDSSILAVGFKFSGDTYLGGVVLSGVADGGMQGITTLVRGMAPVQSELVWFQSSFLGFRAIPANDPNYWTIYHAELNGSSFLPTRIDFASYPTVADVVLRSAPGGLFVVQVQSIVDFYWLVDMGTTGLQAGVTTHATDVIAPSGRYTGRSEGGELKVFSATSDSFAGMPPDASHPGCSVLLSWARDAERVACIADDAGGDAGTGGDGGVAPLVRIFDLNETSYEFALSDLVGAYVYSPSDAAGRRRALSADGKWFAFSTDTTLYVADLTSQPQLVREYPSTSPGFSVELAFSPDSRFLLQQRGTDLWLHDLARLGVAQYPVPGGNALGDAAPCQEDFVQGPASWCGRVDVPRQFVWSPNPRIAAFQTAVGTLEVLDVSTVEPRTIPINDQCGGPCMGQFGFQP
jgi:hypothetical protein